MSKSRSTRRRLQGQTANLFSSNTALGWTIIRQVPIEIALEKVALKQWREIWYENGELAGVQPLKPAGRETVAGVLNERMLAVTITLSEMQRNAGLYGKSKTLGMPEWKRLTRHPQFDAAKILPPEDAIERAIEKVRQWPFPQSVIGTDDKGAPIFGDKAVRVYPLARR